MRIDLIPRVPHRSIRRGDPVEAALAQVAMQKYMPSSDGLPTVGSAFRDAAVVTLDGEPLALSSLAAPGRPLLLNFGSCS